MSKDEESELLGLKGWVDTDEDKWNVPNECPKCGGKLGRTDAIGLVGILFVYCKDSRCRWCKEYRGERK